jgi:hypothetical protein
MQQKKSTMKILYSLLILPATSFPLLPTNSKYITNTPSNYNTALFSTTEEEITIDQYSRCLSPSEEKRSIKKESGQYSIVDKKPVWQRVLGECCYGGVIVVTFPSLFIIEL